ncbi:hypothetical protein HMN09_00877700 [Mycena chlorophos]|uniref:Uncharacterized protein n=1 Tax=Mycena chlorophos TaxID=658473 RepID=A0A8H6SPB3_MYCCL|nr:hypothetical protein HMN09_00877700 [Mycena chlorophos]
MRLSLVACTLLAMALKTMATPTETTPGSDVAAAAPVPSPSQNPELVAKMNAMFYEHMQQKAAGNSTSLEKRSVYCAAHNDNAPFLSDAVAASQHIQNLNTQQCCQTYSSYGCTSMYEVTTAVVWICGPVNSCGVCLDAGNGLLDVSDTCSWDDSSFGWLTLGDCDFAQASQSGTYLYVSWPS